MINKILKKIFDIFKKIFHTIGNYFYNIGKELKDYCKCHLKDILWFIFAIMIIVLFFIFPKIMLLIFVTCIAISIAGVITVMIWLDWQIMQATPDYKYPHLSTLVHLGGWLFFIGFIVWAIVLVILEMYKSLFN